MQRIVVDWGTSNFRAYRFAGDGSIAEVHQASAGILTVTDGDFEAALERQIGAWLGPDCEVFLSGMITSRNGWVETPYAEVPATLAALAAGARTVQARSGATLRFLPGVAAHRPMPDVMRGEEIQVFGSIEPGATVTVVLPGTHSKWVRVEDGRIAAFRTFLTGETFALLKSHSIVGRLMPKDETVFNEAAFRAGVRQPGSPGSAGLLNDIFTARSGALLGQFSNAEIGDRLSGMLIGHEIASAAALGWLDGVPLLVGDAGLCQRYRIALGETGREAEVGSPHATVAGFTRLCALEAAG